MKIIISIILVISSLESFSQISIKLIDFKIYLSPKSCNEQIIERLPDSSYLKINLINCKGEMSIQKFDKRDQILLEGYYRSSMDTLKEYIIRYDVFKNSEEVEVGFFFEPLKEGDWIYYKNGSVYKKEKYWRGVLVQPTTGN